MRRMVTQIASVVRVDLTVRRGQTVGVMKSGELVKRGSAAEICAPSHPYTQPLRKAAFDVAVD